MKNKYFIFAFVSILSLVSSAQDSQSLDLNEMMKSQPNAPSRPVKNDSYPVVEPQRTSVDLNDLKNFVPEPVKPAPKKVTPVDIGSVRPKTPPPLQTKIKMQFPNAMSEEKLQEMGDNWASEMKMSFHPSCGMSYLSGPTGCSTFDKSCTLNVVSQNCKIVEYSKSCPHELRPAYLGRNNRDHKACVRLPETQADSPTYQRQSPTGSGAGSRSATGSQ